MISLLFLKNDFCLLTSNHKSPFGIDFCFFLLHLIISFTSLCLILVGMSAYYLLARNMQC